MTPAGKEWPAGGSIQDVSAKIGVAAGCTQKLAGTGRLWQNRLCSLWTEIREKNLCWNWLNI